jgi:hypothetical protein
MRDPVIPDLIDPAEQRRQWLWFRRWGANAGEAVELAGRGMDPLHPTAGDQLAKLRADRRPR